MASTAAGPENINAITPPMVCLGILFKSESLSLSTDIKVSQKETRTPSSKFILVYQVSIFSCFFPQGSVYSLWLYSGAPPPLKKKIWSEEEFFFVDLREEENTRRQVVKQTNCAAKQTKRSLIENGIIKWQYIAVKLTVK